MHEGTVEGEKEFLLEEPDHLLAADSGLGPSLDEDLEGEEAAAEGFEVWELEFGEGLVELKGF